MRSKHYILSLFMILTLFTLFACGEEENAVSEEPEQIEEANAEQVKSEEVDEEAVYGIIKNTLGSMALNMEAYLESVNYAQAELEEDIYAIIEEGTTGDVTQEIVDAQLELIEVDPHHHDALYYLHPERMFFPLEMIHQDESSLEISYYYLGKYVPHTSAGLTIKVHAEFIKLDTDSEQPWRLAAYSSEPHIKEMDTKLTREMMEDTYELREYVLDREYDFNWEQEIIDNEREIAEVTVDGITAFIDLASGLRLVEYEGNDYEDVSLAEIIEEILSTLPDEVAEEEDLTEEGKEKQDLSYEEPVREAGNYEEEILEKTSDRQEVTIQYPILGNEALDSLVDKEMKAQFEEWTENWERRENELKELEEMTGYLEQSHYEIYYAEPTLTENYASIPFVYSEYYAGGTHPDYFYRPFNYDLKNERELTIQDIVDESQLEALGELLYNKLVHHDMVWEDNLEEATQPEWDNFSLFNLTEDSVIFAYSHYVIAPFSAGIIEVEVTFDELSNL